MQPLDGLPGRVTDLFGQAVESVLKRNGLRERHWHVLHALGSGSHTRAEVAEALLPFWVAASVTQTDVVDDLVRRDWVATDGDRYELTDAGVATVTRIEAALVELTRAALADVSPEDTATTRATLTTITANLERAISSPPAPPLGDALHSSGCRFTRWVRPSAASAAAL